MARSDERVLSRPCRVHWDGWEATTTQLQRAGWVLAVNQVHDAHRPLGRIELAMRHLGRKLFVLASCDEFNFHRELSELYGSFDDGPEFFVRHVACDMLMDRTTFDFKALHRMDAEPQFVRQEVRRLSDFSIFALPDRHTEEIIVEPATVMSLLEQIRKLEQPELAAIRKRNRLRESMGELRAQHHAQIISLEAA